MNVTADQPEAPTAIRTDLGAIFVSLELSRSSWLITSLSPGGGEKMSKHTVRGGDVSGLLQRFAQLREKARVRTGKVFPLIVIQEAGLDGFWIDRVLQNEEVESHVVDPASIATSRRRRRAKTDKIDGETLIRSLLAYKRGEPRVCSMVKAPTPEEEDRRRLCRERKVLTAERVLHVNRIKGLLFCQGISGYEPLRRDRRERLEELQTGDGRPLPPHLKAQVHRRHLNQRQKRDIIAILLKDAPEKSDRSIAADTRSDHHTVGGVRQTLESTGEIPQLDASKGRDGRVRKLPSPMAKAKPEDEADWPACIPRDLQPPKTTKAQQKVFDDIEANFKDRRSQKILAMWVETSWPHTVDAGASIQHHPDPRRIASAINLLWNHDLVVELVAHLNKLLTRKSLNTTYEALTNAITVTFPQRNDNVKATADALEVISRTLHDHKEWVSKLPPTTRQAFARAILRYLDVQLDDLRPIGSVPSRVKVNDKSIH